jgi:hypothetical protein
MDGEMEMSEANVTGKLNNSLINIYFVFLNRYVFVGSYIT